MSQTHIENQIIMGSCSSLMIYHSVTCCSLRANHSDFIFQHIRAPFSIAFPCGTKWRLSDANFRKESIQSTTYSAIIPRLRNFFSILDLNGSTGQLVSGVKILDIFLYRKMIFQRVSYEFFQQIFWKMIHYISNLNIVTWYYQVSDRNKQKEDV